MGNMETELPMECMGTGTGWVVHGGMALTISLRWPWGVVATSKPLRKCRTGSSRPTLQVQTAGLFACQEEDSALHTSAVPDLLPGTESLSTLSANRRLSKQIRHQQMLT